MSLFLSMILLTFAGLNLNAHAADLTETSAPHPGPRSASEAKLLKEEGDSSYASAHFDDARRNYERLIERYPSQFIAVEAYPKLIFIYSDIERKPQKAIEAIRRFMHLKPATQLALSMKHKLAQSYYDLKKYPEAKVTLEEILKDANASPELKLFVLSLKAKVLNHQNRFAEANAALDAMTTEATRLELAAVTSQLPNLRLELKTNECASQKPPRYSKKHTEAEIQIIRYYEDKNACFKSAITPADQNSIRVWCDAFLNFQKELENHKLDRFLKKSLSEKLTVTPVFAASVHADYDQCKEPHADSNKK